ncbi:hypothetical protein [Sphingomonas sp. SRS2]|uniref:hypothetical protein n=1 Tax=Sphingomonas sp. SRS2 TaxID=133190 RepID=UPI000618465A|nr:hypothetical protein [Sphingomonas sp. SRS2]KKC27416.1 hypothetical protein WP12_03265 [Sphingomonas sp. SRS2]
MLDEFQRAAATGAISEDLISMITAKVVAVGGDDRDVHSIAVGACVAVAVAFAATRAISAKAAVALVTLTAEGAAKEIYG